MRKTTKKLVPKNGLELEALCGREASACEPGARSRNPERSEGPQPRMTFRFHWVPKKGLEPPHPCGYMDLNHARLPIPPLRQVDCVAAAASQPPNQEDQLIYFTARDVLSNLASDLGRQPTTPWVSGT